MDTVRSFLWYTFLSVNYNCLCVCVCTELLPDALQTECSKCSDKQKEGAKKVVKFLMEEKPDMWKEIQGKYDPDGTYKKLLEGQLM